MQALPTRGCCCTVSPPGAGGLSNIQIAALQAAVLALEAQAAAQAEAIAAAMGSLVSGEYDTLTGLRNGMLIYFPMDENDGTTTFSRVGGEGGIFTVDGTRPIGDIAWAEGLLGHGINFSGDSSLGRAYVSIPSTADAGLYTATVPELSISLWFRQNVVEASFGILLAKWLGAAPNGSYVLRRHGADGLQFNLVSSTNVTTALQIVGVVTSPTGWNHVVASWSSTDGVMSLYLNTVLIGTVAATTFGIKDIPLVPITIGDAVFEPADTNPFKGSIDEVKLWNRKLTVQEIQSLYQIGGGILGGGGGGGGIEEAPADGQAYSRKDAGWVVSPGGGGGAGSNKPPGAVDPNGVLIGDYPGQMYSQVVGGEVLRNWTFDGVVWV